MNNLTKMILCFENLDSVEINADQIDTFKVKDLEMHIYKDGYLRMNAGTFAMSMRASSNKVVDYYGTNILLFDHISQNMIVSVQLIMKDNSGSESLMEFNVDWKDAYSTIGICYDNRLQEIAFDDEGCFYLLISDKSTIQETFGCKDFRKLIIGREVKEEDLDNFDDEV